MNIWKQVSENTILFEVENLVYIQGCKNCNKVTSLINMLKERQLIGNCYQSLCNCSVCGNYVIFDEHKITRLEIYLENQIINK